MARPVILFDRASINVYLHTSQKAALIAAAQANRESPSSFLRRLIDRETSAQFAKSMDIQDGR